MKPDARTVFELARGRQQLDLHVGMPRDRHGVGGSQRLTACDVGDVDAGEIHGHALSRDRLALRLAMHMKSANLDHAPRRLQHQFIVVRQPTCEESPCHDGAEPLHREDAIDRQPRRPIGRSSPRGGCEIRERASQCRDALTCPRGDRDHWSTFEKRVGHQLLNLEPDDVEHARVRKIGLGDHHQAGGDSEQTADLEVLARLRHDGLVRCDVEHDEIHAANASQHVADEAFVTRYVDERQHGVLLCGVGEAEVDGDAALFLLAQPVGIGAGQRQDERALAMIDMTGGADDDMLHPVRSPRGNISSGHGSEWGPVALAVFKTVAPRSAGRLGSTPRRFRQPSNCSSTFQVPASGSCSRLPVRGSAFEVRGSA